MSEHQSDADFEDVTLKRTLTLPLTTFYGLGTIIGAGIYVLIGAVAGEAGMFAPLSFLIAAIIAGFTAFSYAELSSRLPRSAGEALYIQQAFGLTWLSSLTGWSVVAVGMVSSATLANGFVGYLQVFIPVPDWVVILLLVIGLGLVAAWGIKQAVWFATLITLLEVGGLVLVLVLGREHLLQLPMRWPELVPGPGLVSWSGIMLGSFLAFYAYIGFEDMVNVAEEVIDAPRTLPTAIILALIISTLLYLVVAVVAVLALPMVELSQSRAPLASILKSYGEHYSLVISAISLVAVINGMLIQTIMVSRVLYGMGKTGLAPAQLARLNARTRTPLFSTALVTLVILLFALWLPLATLAGITSFITLLVFTGVNLALLSLKLNPSAPPGKVDYPLSIPVIGAVLSLLLVVLQTVNG